MKHFLLSALLFTIFFSQGQTIDVEAVTAYWKLVDGLRKGQPLTDSAWDSFIAIEGNKTYAESEFTPEMQKSYRRAIEVAYLPQHDTTLKKWLKAGYWYTVLANRYKIEEEQLKRYLADTVQQPGYFQRGYAYVYEYLPRRARHPLPDIHLYYNCLAADAVSYPNGLFFSLLACEENKLSKAGTLEAHELHHRMRQAMNIGGERSRAGGIAAADTGLLWTIMAIPNEGIADMIDKTWELARPGDPGGIEEWLLKPAPEALRKLDSAICSKEAASKKFYRQLLQGTVGHMPGFYMARIICGNGYKKRMINHSDNPFTFFFLYQRAAAKDKHHPYKFSAQAMSRLHSLAYKYKS